MKCTSCGKGIKDGSSFCQYCGARQVPQPGQPEQEGGAEPNGLRIMRARQPQQEKTTVNVLVDKQTKLSLQSGGLADIALQDGQHILDFNAGFINCSVRIIMPEQNAIQVQYDAAGKNLIVTGGEPVASGTFVTPICEAVPNDPVDAPADKAALLQRLQALYKHFACKETQYAEFAGLCEQKEKFKWPSLFWWFVGGLFIGFIVLFILGIILPIIPYDWGIPIWLIVAVLFALVGRAAAKDEANAKYQRMLFRIPELETELINWYNQAPDCCLSYDYSDPHTVGTLVQLVASGRAETLKEALNQMLADINQAQILAEQKRAADSAAATAASAATLTGLYALNSMSGRKRR